MDRNCTAEISNDGVTPGRGFVNLRIAPDYAGNPGL